MSEIIRYTIATVLIIIGIISAIIGIIGVFRFKFVINRMHCAALLDTISMAGILGGLMIGCSSMQYIPKLFAALLVLWIGSPLASHLVARMEIAIDESAPSHLTVKEEDLDESH